MEFLLVIFLLENLLNHNVRTSLWVILEHITSTNQLKLFYSTVAAIKNELYTVKLITCLMYTRKAN